MAFRIVPTYNVLGLETMQLLQFLSAKVPKIFTGGADDMMDRIGQMLNYMIYHLVGPKSLELKVKDPKRFHFNPRVLLTKLVEIYLNFRKEEEFVRAVVNDVRSFKLEVFHRAANVIKREMLLQLVCTIYPSNHIRFFSSQVGSLFIIMT